MFIPPTLLLNDRFRLVEFQLNYVLARCEPRKIRAALKSLPRTLPDAYKDVFTRIERQGPDRKELVIKIVSWIFHARRPLKMTELREAIAVEPGDTELDKDDLLAPGFVVEISESLISYDDGAGTVSFSHFTVHEFLRSSQATLVLPSVDISKVCLTYLGFTEFPGFARGREHWHSIKELLRKYGFLEYALKFWGSHTRDAEKDEDIQKIVLTLLASENTRYGIQIYRIQMMDDYLPFPWVSDFTRGLTSLHTLANEGLATTCKLLLHLKENQNDTYLPS